MKKKTKKSKYAFFGVIFFVLIVSFYLRQQIYLIKFQNRVKQLYDEIRILENKNKQLIIRIQQLKDEERLKEFAKKFGLVPITEQDIFKLNE